MGTVLWWVLGELSWERQRLDFSYFNTVTVRRLDSRISRQMKDVFDIILTGEQEQEKEFRTLQVEVFDTFEEWETFASQELQFLITRSPDEEISKY